MGLRSTQVAQPFFWGSYLLKTSNLTCEQHGAYLLLIADQWTNGELPGDLDQLASICKLDPATFRRHWRSVFSNKLLRKTASGGYEVPRVTEDRPVAFARAELYSQRAQAAARARHSYKHASSTASSRRGAVLDSCPYPLPIETTSPPTPQPADQPADLPPDGGSPRRVNGSNPQAEKVGRVETWMLERFDVALEPKAIGVLLRAARWDVDAALSALDHAACVHDLRPLIVAGDIGLMLTVVKRPAVRANMRRVSRSATPEEQARIDAARALEEQS